MLRLNSINSDPTKQQCLNIDVGGTRQGVAIEVRPIRNSNQPIDEKERDDDLMNVIRNLNDPDLVLSEWTANKEEEKKNYKLHSQAMDLSPIDPTPKDDNAPTPRLVRKLSSKSYQRLSTTMDNFLHTYTK